MFLLLSEINMPCIDINNTIAINIDAKSFPRHIKINSKINRAIDIYKEGVFSGFSSYHNFTFVIFFYL